DIAPATNPATTANRSVLPSCFIVSSFTQPNTPSTMSGTASHDLAPSSAILHGQSPARGTKPVGVGERCYCTSKSSFKPNSRKATLFSSISVPDPPPSGETSTVSVIFKPLLPTNRDRTLV